MTSSYGVAVVGEDLGKGWTREQNGLMPLAVGPQPERQGLLISIQTRYAAAIMAGHKKVELRRRPPKSHPPVVVIYGSGSERSVVGTARLRAIHTDTPDEIWTRFGSVAGVTRDEFYTYFAGCAEASALELTAVAPAAERLTLDDLRSLGLEPPQSWRYVDAEQLCALIAALHPPAAWETTGTQDHEPPPHEGRSLLWALRPACWTWQGIKPIASFSLRCVGLGLPGGPRYPAVSDTATAGNRQHDTSNAEPSVQMPRGLRRDWRSETRMSPSGIDTLP